MKLNKTLKKNSQELRRNMTKEEKKLWYKFFKNIPVTVQRQKVIGPYIVDFYYASKHLIIEVDGRQHYEGEGAINDAIRDEYFRSNGYTVVRIANYEINKDFRNVCSKLCSLMEIEDF